MHDAVERAPEIQVSRNGPYHVRGGIEIDGVERADGACLEHCTLCRCGQSRNKPFCDGSHWYAGFKDDEAITIAKANRGGPRPRRDGSRSARRPSSSPTR